MNLQDPVSRELSEASKKKLSESIKKGLAEGKYKKKFDYCEIEAYDYLGNFIKKFKSKEEAAKEFGFTAKDVRTIAGGYKKGSAKDGIRFRYSVSKVPVQKFPINKAYIGNHFVFFYLDKDGKEKYAFSSVKNC